MEAKVVLLGDSGVGKSSIAQRYCRNSFSDNYDVTIGGAYMQQTVNIDGVLLKMHLWDTGGSDRFRSLVSMYYRDAIAAIICYDLSNERSFQSVDYWTTEMNQKNNIDNFIIAYAGNKSDLPQDQWMIKPDQVQSFVSSTNKPEIICKNTSAKTGDGVKDLFYEVAK